MDKRDQIENTDTTDQAIESELIENESIEEAQIIDPLSGDLAAEEPSQVTGRAHERYGKLLGADSLKVGRMTTMFRDWFLDYASYVILERAVPHLADGLKPVQRRILHALKKMDDGRYNKVANVIGFTMQFHPHGDASIGDALVGLGQKELLIDCQGNWGNVLTGDSAAAPRYIEARLSKFALDVVFNPKTTEWTPSYDGRNEEPVTLPVKFPLLLAQGVEGIAVGLASKILPHNFVELIQASIKYLEGEPYELYPDFITGGLIDVSRYNDGIRGGVVKVRAKITKQDRKTLVITEIPFGKTTSSLIETIIKANEKGKIKIRKVDDNTAHSVEILVHLSPDVSPDKTIDALYAFTDCEVSISPNACVIYEQRPVFMSVSDMLAHSVDKTKYLLGRELEIRLDELAEDWHASSLEKIFIENRIYNSIEQCETWEGVIETIDNELTPFKKLLRRAVNRDDIIRLTEIKIKRISKFDAFRSDDHIRSVEAEIEQVERDLASLTNFTIAYYKNILKKYSAGHERRTEIRSFEQIEATKVAVANAKLYVDRSEGFYGIGAQMKGAEFVGDCSDIDDVILIDKSGKYIITKVPEKGFFAKGILHCAVFKRADDRTIYNVIYRDGKNGAIMVKRCAIAAITRDREYELTKGTPGSEVLYLSVNPNGEAETLRLHFKPRPRLKKLIDDFSFSDISIKGRASAGNLLTRYAIHKFALKDRGISTLAGQNIYWDPDIRRLNTDERGQVLGEFVGDDRIVVFTRTNDYYTTTFDISQHFPEDVVRIEKFDTRRIYTIVYFDSEQKLHYIKRFTLLLSDNRPQALLDASDVFVLLSCEKFPSLELIYGGRYAARPSEMIDADDFIGVKSHRARGKRLSNLELEKIIEREPLEKEVALDEQTLDEPPFDDMPPQEQDDQEPLVEMQNVEPLPQGVTITQGELF
ncbi:MAG: DNA gyrase/topoisomerase IV subunit A [Mucinivorans sp.]